MDAYGLLISFCLGAMLASFAGVASQRVYTGQSWIRGRSRCDSCGATLTGRDLVPLASWLLARGRCRHCGSRLAATHLIAEATLGTLFASAYLTLGVGVPLCIFLAGLALLAFIVLYDLRHTVIPPLSSFLFCLISLAYALVVSPDVHALGATLFMGGIMALFLFILHAASRGRAMGLGDTPLVFSLALLTGAGQAFSGLLFSFWIGALCGIAILLARRGGPTMGIEVPFAPFLAAGFLLAFFTQWHPFLF